MYTQQTTCGKPATLILVDQLMLTYVILHILNSHLAQVSLAWHPLQTYCQLDLLQCLVKKCQAS